MPCSFKSSPTADRSLAVTPPHPFPTSIAANYLPVGRKSESPVDSKSGRFPPVGERALRIQAVMQFADSVFVARALPEGGCKIISIYPREALDTYSPPLEVVLDSGYRGNEVTVTIALCC